MEGMYYKPRVDAELMKQYGKGLIILTGPITGAIGQAAVNEDGEHIKELITLYKSFVGENNVYFELMDLPNVPGQSEANQQLIKYAKSRKWKVVLEVKEVGSGAKERPKREELIKAAKKREIDCILVWKLDRWGRSTVDLINSFQEMQELGIAFVSITEALDYVKTELMPDFDFDAFNHDEVFSGDDEEGTQATDRNKVASNPAPVVAVDATTPIADTDVHADEDIVVKEAKQLEARETHASKGDNLSNEEVDKW